MLWTDFELTQVANIMFWVGTITMIAGGSYFYPSNKYQGSSVSMMTTLKDAPLENLDTIRIKEKRKTKRMIQGLSIATPGIMLMIISWWMFSYI